MQPALSDLATAMEIVQEVLDDFDSPCELIRLSDFDLVAPPGGCTEVTLSVYLHEGALLTDELLSLMEAAGWAICVHQPDGTLVRVRPDCGSDGN